MIMNLLIQGFHLLVAKKQKSDICDYIIDKPLMKVVI